MPSRRSAGIHPGPSGHQGVEKHAGNLPPQFCALSHEERGLMSRHSSRSMYQSLELVGGGVGVDAYASMRLSSWPTIGSKTVRRCTVPQPVLTRDKLLTSVSASRVWLGQHRLDGYGRLGQFV